MSLLTLDWPRLFFKPRSKGLPTDTEHAGNSSHARAFMISADYFFLLLFAPARAKMQLRTFVAVFAPILLPTLSIMSVFHDVHAVTAAASVSDDFFLVSSPYANSLLAVLPLLGNIFVSKRHIQTQILFMTFLFLFHLEVSFTEIKHIMPAILKMSLNSQTFI